ncbi:aminoacyl-tRNA deacylase and HDOD domain-containing protein [Pleionea sediminis]|uniref:aminoacyl-tRNA deacylase and HDOD domain-containing protein n=1 Tax=Pleionea sediminis TaxID=2569479 RepID=UPI0013DDD52F|nr:HDOD domain-containing protein [Pleionea sediminis]
MSIPKNVESYFKENDIDFELVEHPPEKSLMHVIHVLDLPKKNVLRSVLMQGNKGKYLVTLPYEYLLDFEVLKRITNEDFSVITAPHSSSVIKGCAVGNHPPLSELFYVNGIVDESVFELDEVYIESGSESSILKLDKSAIESLFKSAQRLSFACGPERLYSGRNAQQDMSETVNQFTPIRIKQRVDETFDLPAMPEIAQEIMKLRVDPSADAKKLGDIVKKDPSLAAQIISWASSPYYGYKGTIDSVETAISRVLGFDLVMNLALGISIGKSFNVPEDGPLGVHSFWQQAVYSASLVEKLCLLIPPKRRPERGLSYLSGLLHNFGHLLLGHLFPPQFNLINRYIEANPNIPLDDIEHFVMGMSHQEIGAWLMQNWHMPDELIVAVRWHHKEEFWSKHAVYSNLVLLAGRLLKRIDLGDATGDLLPQATLENLQLDEEMVNESFKQLLDERDTLDLMSKQLVA